MKSDQAPRHGGESTLAVSGWTLRRKMALALAIPLTLATAFGALQVTNDLIEATNSSTSASQVEVLRPAVRYLEAVELATVYAQGTTAEDHKYLTSTIAHIQIAATALQAARDTSSLNGEQKYQVDAILDLSRALREDAETVSPGTWVAQLRTLQSGVTQLITTIVNAQRIPEPRLELLSQALAGRFSLAMQQALVATDRNGDTGSLELYSEIGAEGVAIDRLATALGDSDPAIPKLRTANSERFRTVRTQDAEIDFTSYTKYDDLENRLLAGIDKQLSASADSARVRAFAGAGGTLLALLATIMIGFVITRLVLKPINKVREGALSAARVQLPEAVARLRAGLDPARVEPIDVHSKEEVGQLARAVEDLHRQAILLASGEAALKAQVSDMFVTLSRRNTALVNQQLALIEDLEKDEEDPLRLESLFKLDHLAARMRRTGDSLLILADAPGRTSDDGLTVHDAMQAATAGVQEYQRVRLGTTSEVRINAAAAGDVVHLVTELVDNALRYSPPHADVTISAITRPGGVTLEIADGGLGISEEQLTQLNQTLRDGADISPDTARRMGLFVVSRLAQRHGLTATLQRNDRRGTTASVLLPSAILIQHAAPAAPAPPRVMNEEATPEPKVVEPVVATEENVDQINARIAGALGLPVRRPGAALQGQSPASALPQRQPRVVEPVVLEPDDVDPVGAAPALDESEWVEPAAEVVEPAAVVASPVEPVETTEPELEEPDVTETELIEPAAAVDVEDDYDDEYDEVPADEPEAKPEIVVPQQALPLPSMTPTAPPTLAVVRDLPVPVAEPVVEAPAAPPAAPAARAAAAGLDGEWIDPGADDETPIFKAMRSAWLTSGGTSEPWVSSEVEAGWERAEEVAAVESVRTGAGLPQRRPGSRIVPGGVTPAASAAVTRDPEAIRARLAAHAAGVSRGRRIASGSDDDQATGNESRGAGPV